MAEQRVGVGLQCPLRDGRAVAVMLEVVVHILVVDDAAGRGDIALLHRQHDVVVERLVESLDQHVVAGQARAADAESGSTHNVLDVVGDFAEPLRLRDRVLVGLECGVHLRVFGVVESAHTVGVAKSAIRFVDAGHAVEHRVARRQPGVLQGRQHRAAGGFQVQREGRVVIGLRGTTAPARDRTRQAS